MNETIDAIVKRQTPITRADIAQILVAVGIPGQYQDRKRGAVEHLFSITGGGVNPQGHKVVDDLDSYEEY